MKKTITFGLFILAIFSLVACKQETKQKVNDRAFYSLKEAYSSKLLSKKDLEGIAYYYNAYYSNDSKYLYPKPLNKEVENAIKEAKVLEIKSRKNSQGTLMHPEANIEDISIIYYGKYNNCFAVELIDSYTYHTFAMRTVKVGGVEFNYRDSNNIWIWVQETKL